MHVMTNEGLHHLNEVHLAAIEVEAKIRIAVEAGIDIPEIAELRAKTGKATSRLSWLLEAAPRPFA